MITSAVLSPAFIRDRMAVAGCYGDGITPPTAPCEHAPDECAAALARSVDDAALTDASARYAAYRADAGELDDIHGDDLTDAAWAVVRMATGLDGPGPQRARASALPGRAHGTRS
ncbi:hypothetical protein Psed_6847 (plasmid) [Pseudonocardia dioxanivorans CB1190]|uniref:Uncharacterized protein n=1 Tax=Pseudonocardia dioxanivorans (strain ATCC 55486 / DSM 44775 / JCM 13855 / CB1190) TaxID=675635 RepID=F2L6M4_PSEUX|nr:hypothetical protein [Pseudonocardia dioxanivorans]AEA28918.1 hypothetical protein Psed_6847 [Pseudonocardia dioxanivorans CB1190]